ncbi:filamentous hemagglutinin N-terminal domain-containing protein, partial [Prosthecobacter sp. SYSU 5D2]|uniref:two-partner secretion domain-containing protein n=1 Tax=Prosthecobacter sp. SYSU 5D2 TaxID=3134134 RepID=UPI0031FED5E3
MNRLFRDTLMLFTAAISLIPGPYAFANPTGFNLQAGVVAPPIINGNQMIINQASKAAIINWSSFSIALGESTIFNQPAGGAALNRVTGITPSMIEGTLKANGTIWLINPNGTLIGNTGIIQTGSFLASTLDVSNGEFLNYANGLSESVNFSGNSGAAVQNLGKVNASEGDVMLFARHVDNKGEIIAPNGDVGLAAGQEITLVRTGEERIQVKPASAGNVGGTGVDNSGNIEAVQAELKANGGNIYALAVNNSGTVKATGAVMKGGKIFLSAGGGKVTNSGSLTASKGTKGGDIQVTGKDVKIASGSKLDASGALGGGTVLVGGDYQGQGTVPTADTTTVEAGASIKADATEKGNGGKVIVWADQDTVYHGDISARGGVAGGNGGFAEVSGKSNLLYRGLADLRAPAGQAGTLLLDPTNMTISNAAHDGVNNVSWAHIQTQLGLGVLVVTTSALGADPGNITVTDASPDLNSANSLTFNAAGDFIADAAITNTLTGGLIVNAGGAVTINAPVTYNNISLTSGNGGITATGGAITTDSLTVATGATGGVSIQTVAHNIGALQTGGAGVGSGGLGFGQTRPGGMNVGPIISAGNVAINNFGGNVTVTGGITATNSNITLNSSGTVQVNNQINAGGAQVALIGSLGVTQANTGAGITADSLRGQSSSGSVFLNPTGLAVADVNTIATFAGFANDSLSFTNSSGFTVGLVNATQGILTGIGSTTLTVLNAAATISQSAGANGRIETLTLNVTTDNGSVTLNSVNNNIAGLGTINLGAGSFTLVDNVAALSVGAMTANGGISITNGGGSLATTADLTTLGSMSLAATGNIGINNNLTASSLSVHSGTDGTGDLSFGAGVTVQANTQSYRAGNGAGGGTAAVANLVTNNPAFRNTAGAAAPVSFTHRQDAAIADANIAAAAQFGGTVPATYTLQSDDASIILSTVAKVAGSALTLNAGTNLTLGGALNLASLNATGGSGISLNAGSVTTTGTQTYNSAVTLAGDTVLTGTTLTLASGLAGGSNDLTLDFSTAFTLAGGITGVDNFTSEKAININGAFTTTGSQTYNAAATLTGNSTLTGTSLTLASGLVGGGNNLTLDFSTAFTLPGNITGVQNFISQKAININGAFTTTGSQTYNAAATLTGNSTLTGTSLTLASGLTGGGNNLTLDFSTAFTLPGNITGVQNFISQKAININGAFTTTGSQTYNAAATLTGNSTLTGTSLTLASGLTGGGNNLTLDFSTAFTLPGSITGVQNFISQKAININGSFTTTGSQTYNAAVTLTGDSTLTGTTLTLASGLTGGTNDLTLDFSTAFTLAGGITGVDNFTSEKAINVNGLFTTAGTQLYKGTLTLAGNSELAGSTITTEGTVVGGNNNLLVTGNAVFGNEAADTVTGLGTLQVTGTTLINTSAITSASTQTYGGAVTLMLDAVLTSTTAGNISFNSTVDTNAAALALRSLTVNTGGATQFGNGGADNVGATRALASLTTDAAGSTVFNILGGTSVTTSTTQTYNDAVTLMLDTVLASTTSGNVSFNSTVDTDAAALAFRALTVNTGGTTQFGNGGADNVGATRALASLTTDAAGSTVFNILGGTSVTTSTTQTYNDAVTLMLDTVLASTTSGNISFNSTVDTDAAALAFRSLTVNTGGITGFGNGGADNVGATRALLSLTTDAAGSTVFNILGGTSITTSGAQTYNDSVALMLDTALASTTAGNISFNSTVDTDAAALAFRSLTVNTGGATQFGNGGADNVGATRALLSLTTDAGGSTVFNILGGTSVTTSTTQTYNDAVTLMMDTVLSSSTAGNISFNSTVDTDALAAAVRSLTVNTGGATQFGNGGADNVGGNRALASLTTDAAGSTVFNILGGTSVTTAGAQT